jgi:transcriptional regulator with XRE-family HTH domain
LVNDSSSNVEEIDDRISFPVHWLSKNARFKIIDLLLSTRSIRQLAEELGVSTTAIRKYLSRRTHPSDETLVKAINIMAPYEEERLIRIIIDDLVEAIKRLYGSLNKDVYRKYLVRRLREVIHGLE